MYDIFSLQNGFLSALPHLCLWWFSIPWGWFADFLIRSGRLSQQSVRKLSNNVGMIGPSLGLLCLAYAKCDKTFTIFSLCFSCALYGALYSGYQVNLSLLGYIMHVCFKWLIGLYHYIMMRFIIVLGNVWRTITQLCRNSGWDCQRNR